MGITATSFCVFAGELDQDLITEYREGPAALAYTLGATVPNEASIGGVVSGVLGSSGFWAQSEYVIQDDEIYFPGGTVDDRFLIFVRADRIAAGNHIWVTRHSFITAPDEIGTCSRMLLSGGQVVSGSPGNTVHASATSDYTQIILNNGPVNIPGIAGSQYYSLGGGASFEAGGVASPTWNLPNMGSFRFGRIVTFTITPPNSPVPVIAPVWTATTGSAVDLDGSESFDPDDSQTPGAGIADFLWAVQDASAVFHFTGALITYTWDSPGEYLVSLTAVDDEGERSTANQYVVVTD